jgi:hypothetical protein
MLPELPDLNMPYIPLRPEIWNLPEVQNRNRMSDEEREEFHRQVQELLVRKEQLEKANEFLNAQITAKMKANQEKFFQSCSS